MARRHLISIVITAAIALAAVVTIKLVFRAADNRWTKPTNFVEQRAALIRAHQGLGPGETGNTAAWLKLMDDLSTITQARAALHAAHPPPIQPQDKEAVAAHTAVNQKIASGIEASHIDELLDAIAADPRVAATPPSIVPLYELIAVLRNRIDESVSNRDLDPALINLKRLMTLAHIMANTPIHDDHIFILMRAFESATAICESPDLEPPQAERLSRIVQDAPPTDNVFRLEIHRLDCLEQARASMEPHLLAEKDVRAQLRMIDAICDELVKYGARSPAQRRAMPPPALSAGDWSPKLRELYPVAINATIAGGTFDIEDLVETRRIGIITVVAVRRYQLDHDNALPKSLDALVPTYLASVPIDPCSDQPLVYKPSDDTYTLYSIAADGDDNGGTPGPKFSFGRENGEDIILHPREPLPAPGR